MRRAVLVAFIVLSGTVTVSSSSARSSYTYWYHPSGRACPAIQYDPSNSKSATEARKTCEKISGRRCVSGHGTAAPAC